MKPANKFFHLLMNARLATLLCSSLLVSCGGSITSAGIGGTGITSGEITGFGSVFVNGVEFNTDSSQFEVDGEIFANQSDAIAAGLAVGMVAKIDGSTDASGLTGTADLVVYDDEIEGPVEADPVEVAGSGGSQMSFTIFGQEIIIDQASTSFVGKSFDTLVMDDLVEVSGFLAPDSSIHATFVEHKGVLQAGSQVEMKGTISLASATSMRLNAPFDGITFNIDLNTIIDVPGGVLEIGMFVEVEGTYLSPTSIDATEIEEEDNDFGESVDEISLQGIISEFFDQSDFKINGQAIDASGADPVELQDGLNVEVEGSIVGGTLFADELELRQGSVELKAVINIVNLGTGEITLDYYNQTITVSTDDQTRFEDDAGPDITLGDLNSGDFVVVKGIDISGLVTATNVRHRDPDDTEIQGSVENFVANSSITILGISHTVLLGTTNYEINSIPTPDPSVFFTGLKIGDIVEIRDNSLPDAPDGIAEEVSR
jgi:hypothetical protein